MNKAIIIFSGFNQRAVVAFLRTITATDIPFGIIAISKDDPIYKTDYSKYVLAVRDSLPLELDDLLDKLNTVKFKIKADEYVVMPTAEALNRYFLKYRDKFKEISCDMPIVDNDLYEKISDKASFYQLCKSNSINVPEEYPNIRDAILPFVAKPKTFISIAGKYQAPYIIRTEKEKVIFTNDNDTYEYTYQEFVRGKSLYLLYYFYKDGTVTKTSQINLAQQPGGKSIVAAMLSDFHSTDESKKYEDLFKSVGFRGLVMVEVKEFGGKYHMIEANPRFWGPSQLFIDSSVNLFEDFLFDFGFTNQKPVHKPANGMVRYFWYGGVHEAGSFDKLAYHDYSKEQLENSLSAWQSNDVYNRKDTKELYKSELESK